MSQSLPRDRAAASPSVIVCAGGGGVGKTTASAALALTLARGGARTLIVTIDPARRLAGAIGSPISDVVTPIPLGDTDGRLSALMPDPRRSMTTFMDQLFEGEPEARARLQSNRLYQGLGDAAAGVHELVAMNLVAHASSKGAFDVIVIDTAPSRHAIDFVTYPGRLSSLLGGRTVGWLAGLAQRAEPRADTGPGPSAEASPRKRGLLSWGTDRVESLLARVTGPHLVRDTASLFSDLAIVRERFASLCERASELLLGERARYVLVAAPTAAARDDVIYLAGRLAKLGRAAGCIVMNRADLVAAPHIEAICRADGVPPVLAEAARVLETERQARTATATRIAESLGAALPGVPIVRLPYVEALAPDAIVLELAQAFAPLLDVVAPRAVPRRARR